MFFLQDFVQTLDAYIVQAGGQSDEVCSFRIFKIL